MKHTAQSLMEAALKAQRLDPKQTVFIVNHWTALNQWQLALGQQYELEPIERKNLEAMFHKVEVAYTRVMKASPTARTADIRFNCQIAMKSLEAIVERKTNKAKVSV